MLYDLHGAAFVSQAPEPCNVVAGVAGDDGEP
jgi:hypothetical protein